MTLNQTRRKWIKRPDGSVWEERTKVGADVECPRCRKTVDLWAETEEHTLGDDDGRWHHSGYGPSTATCCGLLIADWWEGTFVYDMARTEPEEQEGAPG